MQLNNDFEDALKILIDQFDERLVRFLDAGGSVLEPAVQRVIKDSGILPILERELDGDGAANYLVRATFLASTRCGNLKNLFLVSFGMVGEILRYCSPISTIAKDYRASLFREQAVGALAVTEGCGGTDYTKHETAVTFDSDNSLVLNGVKTWITFGARCNFYLVQCKFRDALRLVLVSADSHGVHRERISAPFGNRGSDVGTVFFKNVVLTESQILPPKINGFLTSVSNGTPQLNVSDVGFRIGRLIAAASGLGLGTSCIEHSIRELKNRTSFGRPIIDQGSWKSRLANLLTERNVLRSAVCYGLEHYEHQLFAHIDYWTPLKIRATEFAKTASGILMEACGSRGYVDIHSASRFVRDAIAFDLIEGATEPLMVKCFVDFQKEMLMRKAYDLF